MALLKKDPQVQEVIKQFLELYFIAWRTKQIDKDGLSKAEKRVAELTEEEGSAAYDYLETQYPQLIEAALRGKTFAQSGKIMGSCAAVALLIIAVLLAPIIIGYRLFGLKGGLAGLSLSVAAIILYLERRRKQEIE